MPRLKLDPTSPSGVSAVQPAGIVPYRQQSNGYVVNKATGLIGAGTNVTITGNGTAESPYVISASGSGGGSGTPGGTTTQVQYNNAGAFGGANAYWDNVNNRLGINVASPGKKLEVGGHIIAHTETVGGSASLFLNNDNGQLWEFFANTSGSFGVFDNTHSTQPLTIDPSAPTDSLKLLNGFNMMSQDLDLGSHQIHSLADPTAAQHGATKAYVDSLIGMRRVVTTTSGNYTAGSVAKTDYVYLIAGAHTTTLPTASGNSNRYTIKNTYTAAVAVNRAGSDTIEGAASISIAPNDSVDLVSNNGSAWNVI